METTIKLENVTNMENTLFFDDYFVLKRNIKNYKKLENKYFVILTDGSKIICEKMTEQTLKNI